MFLAYFSVFPPDVDRLQTTRTHGFGLVCVAPGADQDGMDDELVEVLVVVRHPRRISRIRLGRTFFNVDDEG